MFMETHSEYSDALGGSAPAARASPGYDSVDLPVHKAAENFSTEYTTHRNTPPLPVETGQAQEILSSL